MNWEERKMQNSLVKKSLVVGIFVLFIGAGFSIAIGSSFNSEKDVSSLIFYAFSRTGSRKCEIEVDSVVSEEISVMFEDVKDKLTCDPLSDQTFELKNDFVIVSYSIGPSYCCIYIGLNPYHITWY